MDNIAHNMNNIRAALPDGCKFLGVIKADAYGHGAVQVAKRLEASGCDHLAVACLDEALDLRSNGIHLPILVLGYTDPCYAGELAAHEITQAVGSFEMAQALSERAAGQQLHVHMKLETGMGRTGFRVLSAEEMHAAADALQLPNLVFDGVFTHFAVSDEYGDPFTQLQFERFMDAVSNLEQGSGRRFAIRHCANSGAVINYKEYCLDMVRPGIATYGIYPAKETGGLDLRPAMELKTRVAQITTHQPGDSISYGRTFVADAPMRIAVLPIGYADGLRRNLSGKLEVLIHGQRVRQIGRICMDMCMVDVTDIPDVQSGDVATIFGRDGEAFISIDELAEKAGTISYELLCAVSPRVPRIYLA